MQTFLRKTLKYLLFIFILNSQFAYSQESSASIKSADFFFKKGNLKKSDSLYKQLVDKNSKINPNIFLKLAKIAISKNDEVEALYYLNVYNRYEQNEEVNNEILKIAERNNFEGYEKENLNSILMIFMKFIPYFLIIFSILIFYIQYSLLKRINLKEKITIRHYIIVSALILGLLFVSNLDNNLSIIILKNDNVVLKESPNATSKILLKLNKGTKLNSIGQDDIWIRVLIDNKLYFINQADVFQIKT